MSALSPAAAAQPQPAPVPAPEVDEALLPFVERAEEFLQPFFDFADNIVPAPLQRAFAAWAIAHPLGRLHGGELAWRTKLLQLREAVNAYHYLTPQQATFWKNNKSQLLPYVDRTVTGERDKHIHLQRALWVQHVFQRFFEPAPRPCKQAQKIALAWLDLTSNASPDKELKNNLLDKARRLLGYGEPGHIVLKRLWRRPQSSFSL